MAKVKIPAVQFVSHPERQVCYPDTILVRRCSRVEEPDPVGYGENIKASWIELGRPTGLIVLEQDIAASYEGLQELFGHASERPEDIFALPYLLYPVSTGLGYKAWAHRVTDRHGGIFFKPWTEFCPEKPSYFGLGATYLPAALLECSCKNGLSWHYPRTDTQFSELAISMKRPCRVVGPLAIHLHF